MNYIDKYVKNELISELNQNLKYNLETVDMKNYKIDISDLSTKFSILCATLGIVYKSNGSTYQAFLDGNPINLQYLKKSGSGFVAMTRDASGNIRQADLVKNINLGNTAIAFSQLCLAMATHEINKKLDNIKEMQSDLLEFIAEDKKANMRANCHFLNDIMNNYQLNSDNDIFKTNNHIKALDIKQIAMGNIELYRKIILRHITKKKLFYRESEVRKVLNKVEVEFHNYQLALYLFSYSSLVEIILLENYSKEYLESVLKNIREYGLVYKELYTLCYNTLEKFINSNILTNVFNNIDKVSENLENALLKTPANKVLKSKYKKNNTKKEEKVNTPLFLEKTKEDPTILFFDSINSLNMLYNYVTEIHIKNNKLHAPIYF